MRVYCISGKAGVGKDTFAGFVKDALEDRGETVLVTHFAWLVKRICGDFFGWDGRKDEHGRTLLQYVGTDVVRQYYPNFWVDFIAQLLMCFQDEWDTVLIPDARFPNEIDRMRELLQPCGISVTHIRVTRPGLQSSLTAEQQSHPSETALDGFKVDIPIKNGGTINDFRELCQNFADDIAYGGLKVG